MGVTFNFNSDSHDEIYDNLRVHPDYPFMNGDLISWYEQKDFDITNDDNGPTEEELVKIEEALLELGDNIDDNNLTIFDDEELNIDELVQKWGLLLYEPEVGAFIVIPYLNEDCTSFDENTHPPFLFEIGIDAIFYPEGYEPWLDDDEDDEDEDPDDDTE